MDSASAYSSQPVLIDSPSAQETLADNKIIMSPERSRKRCSSQAVHSNDERNSMAKRQLILDDIVESSAWPHEYLPLPTY